MLWRVQKLLYGCSGLRLGNWSLQWWNMWFFLKKVDGGALSLWVPSLATFVNIWLTVAIVLWTLFCACVSSAVCGPDCAVRFGRKTIFLPASRQLPLQWFPTYPIMDFYCVQYSFRCLLRFGPRYGWSGSFFYVNYYLKKKIENINKYLYF